MSALRSHLTLDADKARFREANGQMTLASRRGETTQAYSTLSRPLFSKVAAPRMTVGIRLRNPQLSPAYVSDSRKPARLSRFFGDCRYCARSPYGVANSVWPTRKGPGAKSLVVHSVQEYTQCPSGFCVTVPYRRASIQRPFIRCKTKMPNSRLCVNLSPADANHTDIKAPLETDKRDGDLISVQDSGVRIYPGNVSSIPCAHCLFHPLKTRLCCRSPSLPPLNIRTILAISR